MDKIFIQVLLAMTISSVSSKYVYVKEWKTWTDAQKYCREYYTDLAPVSGPADVGNLMRTAGAGFDYAWIGLMKGPQNTWMWSGGSDITYQYFAPGNPTNDYGSVYGYMSSSTKWKDSNGHSPSKFFCLHLIVVPEPKTWEEALEYCRGKDQNLTSLLSETELLLAQREIGELAKTDLVWTGLRYLGDRWLWVNGDPLTYQAWPQGGEDLCPARHLHCGAVGKEGPWQAHNCLDKLNFICF